MSFVVPVHGEEAIIEAAVETLRIRLGRAFPAGLRYELWLAENGSRDRTAAIAAEIAQRYPEVHTFSLGMPNYGRALQEGIARARGRFVVCEEIDLCDVDFHRRALELLATTTVDLVVGSKLLPGAEDERPIGRHAASLAYNSLLRFGFGFRGTDTHGLKAFRRDTVAPIAARCVSDRDVYASELVIRCYRAALDVREIPVTLRELRPPTIHLWRRVPNVLRNLVRLRRALG